MKKEAYLVPFNCKINNNPVTYGTMVTFIPGYKGLQKLCINAGMKSMTAKVVFAKDRFVFNEMDGEVTYEYSPSFDKDRGEPVCVLTVATMQDGTKDIKVLPYHKVLEIKAKAKSQGGPWATYEEEMAMKTAVRRHCNQLPQSLEDPALAAAITIDELAESGKTSFHTPEGMESIVDADYESVVDAVQNAEAPQSTKPVVSAPKLADEPKQAKTKPEAKKPSSNLETLMDMTGRSKEVIEKIIFAEWEVRDVNAVDDSTFSGIFDSFVNGLIDLDGTK
jgi:recombinational DNA repair protein RecT